MVVGIKDSVKLIGISIITCCAAFVCNMFLNYYCDVLLVKYELTSEQEIIFYNAMQSSSKVICLVTGGCLTITSIIMLLFYIKHYIDTHKKELGILKALGYSNLKVAENFWIFGISILIGATLGYGGSFLMIPEFYRMQNKDHVIPEIIFHFHPLLLLCLVILPTLVFAFLAIWYAYHKLKRPVLMLLKDDWGILVKSKKNKKDKNSDLSFLEDLKKNTLRSKKALVFFMIFASFCFSAMTQMSFSIEDLSSKMMSIMVLLIGLILASVTLYLAITTVIVGNTKTIAMMRVFGYSQSECCRALLGGYRPLSYLGFAIGTIYQYGLIRIMVEVVFKEIEGIPSQEFNLKAFLLSLAIFILIYELLMFVYTEKIKKISVKEIMLES